MSQFKYSNEIALVLKRREIISKKFEIHFSDLLSLFIESKLYLF